MLVLDSGGVSRLARRDTETAALILALRRRELWPPTVPTVVLAESLTGSPQREANSDRLLKACDLRPSVSERVARRAAELRTNARKGSAVDALVVAIAEPGSTVLTSDAVDLRALAASASDVAIDVI